MGIGVSLILIAVGAVLAFAVNATASGFNVHTVGWILLAVGALGVLLSLVFWSSWRGFGGSRTVVSERPARRRTVVEDEVARPTRSMGTKPEPAKHSPPIVPRLHEVAGATLLPGGSDEKSRRVRDDAQLERVELADQLAVHLHGERPVAAHSRPVEVMQPLDAVVLIAVSMEE
jgi:Domain of unknown function (DUF6458)